jgi:nucleoid-associated protein YgaU
MSSSSGALAKMKIVGYSDKDFQSEVAQLTVQINPATLKRSASIGYHEGQSMGVGGQDKKFDKIKPSSVSFEFVVDETGVVDLPTKTIGQTLTLLEKIAYKVNSETHEPGYVAISWGSFLYKGRTKSLDYEYTLFRPDGSPVRAKVTLAMDLYLDAATDAKQQGLQSPDMTRTITLTAGDSLPLRCLEIYGDAAYCTNIARINNLSSFRSIAPGTALVFPPLKTGTGDR